MAELFALHYSNAQERTSPAVFAVSEDVEKLKALAEARHQEYNSEPAGVFQGESYEAEIAEPLEWSQRTWRGEEGQWDASAGYDDDDWWQIYPIKVL